MSMKVLRLFALLAQLYASQVSASEVDPPLLPPRDPKKLLTLVLDLDETLVFNRNLNPSIPPQWRPGAFMLLEYLDTNPEIEVILWTAAAEHTCNEVIASLPFHLQSVFTYVITRDTGLWFYRINPQTKKRESSSHHTKNIGLLGRSLSSVVIVDNFPECLYSHPRNSLLVEHFLGVNSSSREVVDFTMMNTKRIITSIYDHLKEHPTHDVAGLIEHLATNSQYCFFTKPIELSKQLSETPLVFTKIKQEPFF
jgi:hypothetical protein